MRLLERPTERAPRTEPSAETPARREVAAAHTKFVRGAATLALGLGRQLGGPLNGRIRLGHTSCLNAGVDPIRAQLAADHHVLDDLFARLVHDVHVLSHGDLLSVWCELEHRLLSHMDVEEQLLWPLLDEGHRAALDHARSDHARIRGAVNALGAAVELRTVRESDLQELMRFLHHHAEREDAFLYRFACERAPVAVQFRMATTLRTAAHAAHVAALKTTANRSGTGPDLPSTARQRG